MAWSARVARSSCSTTSIVPDGVFVANDDRLAFALHPVPTSADVLAIAGVDLLVDIDLVDEHDPGSCSSCNPVAVEDDARP